MTRNLCDDTAAAESAIALLKAYATPKPGGFRDRSAHTAAGWRFADRWGYPSF